METCTLGIFNDRADVVVFGATPGGIAAAVSAKRNGASVLLLSANERLGGMVTGGIAATDYDAAYYGKGLMVGFGHEFYWRMARKYNKQSMQKYNEERYPCELWRAKETFQDILNDYGIPVIYSCELISVSKTGAKLTSIKTTKGTFFGKAFVDSTYEGDLLAAAGVGYSIGRDANATYSETNNGVRSKTAVAIDPYVTPGVSASGLIAGLELLETDLVVGAADPRVQAFTYRFALTASGPKNPIPEPDTYDAADFEGIGRYIALVGGAYTLATDVLTFYNAVSPNFDINNKGYFSTNWVGPECTEYITATYARRREIEAQIRNYVLGVLKFLQTDSRVPAAVRTNIGTYGVPVSEHAASDNFPVELYVREGRRMISDVVLKEPNIVDWNAFLEPISFFTYEADSHICRRYVHNGNVYAEGGLAVAVRNGAFIPRGIIVPKKSECENLAVTFAVSASNVAFATCRMEPQSMAFGDAAGAICAQAASRGIAVQDVTYAEILPRIGMGRKYLARKPGSALINSDGTGDGTLTTSGTWTASSYRHDGVHIVPIVASATGATARFKPKMYRTQRMNIYLRYPIVPDAVSPNRSNITPVTIVHLDGTTSLTISQKSQGLSGNVGSGDWDFIGSWIFRNGDPSADYVQIGTDATGAGSLISAVLFEPAEDLI